MKRYLKNIEELIQVATVCKTNVYKAENQSSSEQDILLTALRTHCHPVYVLNKSFCKTLFKP